MLNFIVLTLLFSASVGIIAAVYVGVLAYSPVLHWWFRFGARYEKRWFYDPVWGCVKCVAGQLALWLYLFLFVFPVLGSQQARVTLIGKIMAAYAAGTVVGLIFGLIASICGAIITAMAFARIIYKLENR